MRSEIIRILLHCLLAAVSCRQNQNLRHIARASNKFGDDVYRELAKETGENIVFAPFSVHSVLSMVALGAEGRTKRELLTNLYILKADTLRKGYAAITRQRNNDEENSLHMANTLFSSKTYPMSNSYKAEVGEIFDTTPQEVDFKAVRKTTNVINEWVTSQTNGTIRSVVKENLISSNTAIFLVSALYFKGAWAARFNKSDTIKNFMFHAPNGNINCEMMVKRHTRQKLVLTEAFSMLELDFKNTNIKIAFIKSFIDFSELEKLVDSRIVLKLRKNLRSTVIDLGIPKFTLGSELPLVRQLERVGISSIFTNPDLSYLFGEEHTLVVDNVFQKTKITINEEGATASATTIVTMVVRSPPTIPVFLLDRPFLFFLYDSKTEVVLLRGRIVHPLA